MLARVAGVPKPAVFEDLFELLLSHEPGNVLHRGKQCGFGEVRCWPRHFVCQLGPIQQGRFALANPGSFSCSTGASVSSPSSLGLLSLSEANKTFQPCLVGVLPADAKR